MNIESTLQIVPIPYSIVVLQKKKAQKFHTMANLATSTIFIFIFISIFPSSIHSDVHSNGVILLVVNFFLLFFYIKFFEEKLGGKKVFFFPSKTLPLLLVK